MYRDACEWENLASIFHHDAYIYTTWTGRTHHADFIAASKRGMDCGAFIMHRCHGVTTDIGLDARRAVTKMKATITQRFEVDGCQVDAESDCRFCFFWEKDAESGDWKAHFTDVSVKDKLIAVTPDRVPKLDYEALKAYPSGYRHLAYLQEKTMGVKVARDMPGHRRENGAPGGSQACGDKHDLLYWQCKNWVEAQNIDI
ncbi:hypothetical protein LTR17_027673 [Elasticomyces elasticus]|nr:hypothetical protein LTR17_027673 [Elasticomyces elasticus]